MGHVISMICYSAFDWENCSLLAHNGILIERSEFNVSESGARLFTHGMRRYGSGMLQL